MPRYVLMILATAMASLLLACSSKSESETGKVIKSAPAGNNLTVELSTQDGVLKSGDQTLFLVFKDASGNPTEIGAVSLNFFMPAMGTMPAMNNPATFTTTNTPGIYRGKVQIEMAGEWQAQITYEGPAGKGKATFSVYAQ